MASPKSSGGAKDLTGPEKKKRKTEPVTAAATAAAPEKAGQDSAAKGSAAGGVEEESDDLSIASSAAGDETACLAETECLVDKVSQFMGTTWSEQDVLSKSEDAEEVTEEDKTTTKAFTEKMNSVVKKALEECGRFTVWQIFICLVRRTYASILLFICCISYAQVVFAVLLFAVRTGRRASAMATGRYTRAAMPTRR